MILNLQCSPQMFLGSIPKPPQSGPNAVSLLLGSDASFSGVLYILGLLLSTELRAQSFLFYHCAYGSFQVLGLGFDQIHRQTDRHRHSQIYPPIEKVIIAASNCFCSFGKLALESYHKEVPKRVLPKSYQKECFFCTD